MPDTQDDPKFNAGRAFRDFMIVIVALMALTLTFMLGAIVSSNTERVQIKDDLCYEIIAEQTRYIGWKLIPDPGYVAYVCDAKVKQTAPESTK